MWCCFCTLQRDRIADENLDLSGWTTLLRLHDFLSDTGAATDTVETMMKRVALSSLLLPAHLTAFRAACFSFVLFVVYLFVPAYLIAVVAIIVVGEARACKFLQPCELCRSRWNMAQISVSTVRTVQTGAWDWKPETPATAHHHAHSPDTTH
jgi:hypothetical protein